MRGGKMKNEVKNILTALNSTGPNLFKYPIGNKELTEKVKELEQQGKIEFCSFTQTWKRKN